MVAAASDRLRVQFILRLGLSFAAALMLVGLALKIASADYSAPNVSIGGILTGALDRADQIMGLGILILSLTPVFRVVMLVFLWIRENDWRFVGVAILVLAVLILAMSLGGG